MSDTEYNGHTNWDEYADTFTDACVFVERPRTVHVFDADFNF